LSSSGKKLGYMLNHILKAYEVTEIEKRLKGLKLDYLAYSAKKLPRKVIA
jgi:hypothetical protein